jgi:hypothetical protein
MPNGHFNTYFRIIRARTVAIDHTGTCTCIFQLLPYGFLPAFIFLVDTNTTADNDRVTVRLNDNCVENPTMFISTLSYGSCHNSVTFQESQAFSSSGSAVFVLNLSSVTGNLCIRVEVAHQSQSNRPLNTLERQLNFSSCPVAPINSLAGSRVSVQFSSSESSGTVDHGTEAMFVSSSSAYTLDGPSQSTCRNGMWTDIVERQTNRKHIYLHF